MIAKLEKTLKTISQKKDQTQKPPHTMKANKNNTNKQYNELTTTELSPDNGLQPRPLGWKRFAEEMQVLDMSSNLQKP